MKYPKVLTMQLGARMHYAIPRLFYEKGMLVAFSTDFYITHSQLLFEKLGRFLPIFKRAFGRYERRLPITVVHVNWLIGIRYWLKRVLLKSFFDPNRSDIEAGRSLGIATRCIDWAGATVVYGYNYEAFELFIEAKQRGCKCVLEQTIAPREVELQYLDRAFHEFPDLCSTNTMQSSWCKQYIAREHKEWELADVIVCGSEFVRAGIASVGGPIEKCVVVPYGIDYPKTLCRPKMKQKRIQILTVGEAGYRKGVAYLIEAARKLQDVAEFHWIGYSCLNSSYVIPPNITFHGKVPRAEVVDWYNRCDVFVLPSLCEGSATVVYEALSSGLPAIVTPNCGSVVRDYIDGVIIEPFSSDAIVMAIKHFLENELLLEKYSENAQELSALYSVKLYGDRLLDALKSKGVFE